MDWLQKITTTIAERTGTDAESLALDDGARAQILDVARTASHSSGDRRNAPLLCYVLGMLVSRGVALKDAIAIVEDVT